MNYLEQSDVDETLAEVAEVNEIVEEIFEESVNQIACKEKIQGGKSPYELNQKKQYKRILDKSNFDDWTVDETRNQPKGNNYSDSFFVYIIFHPAIFQLVMTNLMQCLQQNFKIMFSHKKPDRYGKAITKDVNYYRFNLDGRNREIVVNLYPTTTSMDVRLKGSNEESLAKFVDIGNRNVPCFFVEEVLPSLMEKLYRENNINDVKKYWTNLAQKGFDKATNDVVSKGTRGRGKTSKNKCFHCDKQVGKKAVIICKHCKNYNLEECLGNLERRDFRNLNQERKILFVINVFLKFTSRHYL